jgi:hypothetical protein
MKVFCRGIDRVKLNGSDEAIDLFTVD